MLEYRKPARFLNEVEPGLKIGELYIRVLEWMSCHYDIDKLRTWVVQCTRSNSTPSGIPFLLCNLKKLRYSVLQFGLRSMSNVDIDGGFRQTRHSQLLRFIYKKRPVNLQKPPKESGTGTLTNPTSLGWEWLIGCAIGI